MSTIDHNAISMFDTAGLRCPSCAVPMRWGDHDGHCARCGRSVAVRGGRIVDFMAAPSGAGEEILGWPDGFLPRVESGLLALRVEGAAPGEVVAELERAGLADASRGPARLTRLGHVVAYHLAESLRQADGDGIDDFRRDSALGSESRVLDLGCGAGQTLRQLDVDCPAERTGLDVSLEALALGCRLLAPGDPSVRFLRATADPVPLLDGWFSHVISRVALNYMPQRGALREIVRLLRPGGYVYCRVEGPGFDLRLLRNGRSAKQLLGRLRDLFWGLSLECVGWRPDGNPRWAGERAFATARRLRRFLRPHCRFCEARVTGHYLGLPLGFEVVARKR